MYEFKALAENVYVFVQPALVWYSTAGVIVGERDVIVVDSLTNSGKHFSGVRFVSTNQGFISSLFFVLQPLLWFLLPLL